MTRTMGHTRKFILISEVLALVLGIAVGVYSASRQYSGFDYTFTTIASSVSRCRRSGSGC